MNLAQSRANLMRDARDITRLRESVIAARTRLEAGRRVFTITLPATTPGGTQQEQRYGLPERMDWDGVARNPLLRGQGAASQPNAAGVAKKPSKALYLLPVMGGLFLVFGLLILFVGGGKKQPASQAALAPTATATPQPTAAIGPPHAGFAPPSTLSVQAGSVSQSWNITSYAEQTDGILISGAVRTTSGLAHFGKYPGERGNVVLAGSEKEIGELKRVAVNDSVSVTTRDGRVFLYRIIACDPKTQHKECIVAVNDDWALGWTPRDEQVGLVEDYPQAELTIVVALNPPADDPTNLQNYVLRARLYGTKSKLPNRIIQNKEVLRCCTVIFFNLSPSAKCCWLARSTFTSTP